MSTLDLVRRLSATQSRIEKEQLLTDAFIKGERAFFLAAQLAYDPLISFGVKKVAEIIEDDGEAGTFTFSDFLVLAGRLRRRELTGHAARDAIHSAAAQCDAATWNEFYRRVLLKDLGIGVTDSTINKILKKLSSSDPDAGKYIITIFSCQLAHDGAKPPHSKKIKGKKLLDVKFDGARLLTILDKENGTVNQYTRNGKEVENFTAIREAFAKLLPHLPASIVLDGEVVGRSFQELMTQFNRQSDVDTSGSRLALFDIIPLSDFKLGVCKMTQEQRHEVLSGLATSGMLSGTVGDLAYVVPKVSVDLDTTEGQEQFKEFNSRAVSAGYEGVMVKDPDAPYECKRSPAWLKIKPFIEVSLEVVAVENGEAEGKFKDVLGRLVCEGEDDGRKIRVLVGGGFTEEQRVEFWDKRAFLIGMIAEVRADAYTKPEEGDVWSLRFPRFKGWRGTTPREKI